MTKAERARRRALVAAERARGFSWDAIRERHGIPERTGRRDLERWHAAHPSEMPDPERAFAEALAFAEQAIDDLARLADETRNEAVKLGAIKARLDAAAGRLELMRALGRLPPLSSWRTQRDFSALMEHFIELLDRHDVPEPVLREFAELATEAKRDPRRLPSGCLGPQLCHDRDLASGTAFAGG